MARQSVGTGSVRKRSDGTFEYRVYVGTGMDGKPLRKSFYGKTKKEATWKYTEWLKDSGNTPIERVETVGVWADKWLELYRRGKVAYSTYVNNEVMIRRHIKPHIGGLKLEQVRPAHIEQLYSKIPGAPTRRKVGVTLKAIFDSAIENRLCSSNPVRVPPLPPSDPEAVKVFSPDEIAAILAASGSHQWGHYAALLLYTGLREGELCALTWGDVDLTQMQITVRAAMTRSAAGGFEVGETKSRRFRIVPIGEPLAALLNSLPRESFFVLSSDGGAPLTPWAFCDRYERFFKDAGLFYLSPHKCRHTYATYLLRGGADLRTVQTLLGHSGVNITEIYTHVNADQLRNGVIKLGY